MGVPTNIATSVSGNIVAIGNPGNSLSFGFGPTVAIRVGNSMVRIAHPGSTGRGHSLRNLAEALVRGVIVNIARNCSGALRMGNINCHIRGRNGGYIVGLNCSRRIVIRSARSVGVRIPSPGGVVVANVSGRGINRFTTRMERGHPPRPCGNGNVGCTSRIVHHGRNGTNGNGWLEDRWLVMDEPSAGGTHTGHRGEIHDGVDNATSYPHLYMFHSADGVCTRVVSSMTNIALTRTSDLSGRVANGNKGGRTTGTINGLITRHTGRGGVISIMFSENNGVCRNHIGRLTRNTHRNNLGFWKLRRWL